MSGTLGQGVDDRHAVVRGDLHRAQPRAMAEEAVTLHVQGELRHAAEAFHERDRPLIARDDVGLHAGSMAA